MSLCVGREGLRAQAVSDLPPTGWAALRPPEPAALHLQDVHLRLKAGGNQGPEAPGAEQNLEPVSCLLGGPQWCRGDSFTSSTQSGGGVLQALPELCGARGVGWVLSHVASPESQKRIRFLGTSATHDHHLVTGPGGAALWEMASPSLSRSQGPWTSTPGARVRPWARPPEGKLLEELWTDQLQRGLSWLLLPLGQCGLL